MAKVLGVLRRSTWPALGIALVAGVALIKPVGLPQRIATTLSGADNSTVPEWYSLNSAHYGADASFGGGNSDCDKFTPNPATGATHYDGWHFVIVPNTAPTYNVNDWQVVFRDNNGAGAEHKYRITVNGTTATAVPASGVTFSKNFTQIAVLTPTSGHYRLITAEQAKVPTTTVGGTFALDMYAHSANMSAIDNESSPAKFNLSGTCADRPFTLFPHADCEYGADDSVLTVPATSKGTIAGTLTCKTTKEAGETVRFTTSNGAAATAVTTSSGAFSHTFGPADFPVTVSYPGTAVRPAAPSVTVTYG